MLSMISVVASLTLDALGVLPQPVMVLAVIVVGFTASWVRSADPVPVVRAAAHRTAVVPLRGRPIHV